MSSVITRAGRHEIWPVEVQKPQIGAKLTMEDFQPIHQLNLPCLEQRADFGMAKSSRGIYPFWDFSAEPELFLCLSSEPFYVMIHL